MRLGLLIVLFLCCAIRTQAQAARPALHWMRAAGAEACIDPITLAQRVETLTGPVLVSASQAELALAGEVLTAAAGFRVRIVASGRDGIPRGERILTSADRDCRKLDPAIAFVIALMIDPQLSLTGVPSELLSGFTQEIAPEEALLEELNGTPATPVTPAPLPVTAAAQVAAETKVSAAQVAHTPYLLAVGIVASGGLFPSWVPGGQLSAGWSARRPVKLVLGGRYSAGLGADQLSAGDKAVFRGYELAIAICPRLASVSRLSAHACAGGGLAYLTAKGVGFYRNHHAALWDPAANASLSLWLRLARGFSVWLDGGVRVRLTSQRFEMRSGERAMTAHRPERVGVVLAFGAGFAF